MPDKKYDKPLRIYPQPFTQSGVPFSWTKLVGIDAMSDDPDVAARHPLTTQCGLCPLGTRQKQIGMTPNIIGAFLDP
jgi:hypothetical protein